MAVTVQEAKVTWKRLPLSSNYAAAYAVKDLDVDVIAAYPITPQTTVVEKIAEFIANGELNAEMIHVESEHSALSATIAASAAGARAFTATASQGLELMHEILHIASGLRLPVVMSIATRALSAPISIWNDYSDLMNTRDTSWITLIASSAQEVYDSIVQAYRIAEDPEVMLPVMVAYDGYLMSHTYEPVLVPEDNKPILDYAPKNYNRIKLDPERPISMGTLTGPEWYYEFKYQQVVAMKKALEKARKADEEFKARFGRGYGLIETFNVEDADVVIVAYGGLYGTVIEAIEPLVEKGVKVGAMRLRLWRPFPVEDVKKALGNAKLVTVIDKAISYGARIAGPVALEVMSSFYHDEAKPMIMSVIAGIGQRRITEDTIREIVDYSFKVLGRGRAPEESLYWGVRGVRYE
ncbi:MAG: ferredoxin oxidoreductase [Desulfurococcales archaeon]|nr:ferredoxin oxidoreductase [Desulfurococcales archaeon]